jgi:ParB family chromosome partitioning protein
MNELFDVGRIAGNQPIVHGSHNLSGNIEWYTPAKYIDSARSVMDSIDCDPCTSELAQQVIQAKTHYTIETDGLAHPWSGTVWMNPPYAAKIITQFVDKLMGHLHNGDVKQAIMLTHNNADTAWFHKAAMNCTAGCLTRGRVRFYDENGQGNSPTHGHIFLYFGRRHKRFAQEFRQYGWIVKGVFNVTG